VGGNCQIGSGGIGLISKIQLDIRITLLIVIENSQIIVIQGQIQKLRHIFAEEFLLFKISKMGSCALVQLQIFISFLLRGNI
jgi:hypothetical protein